MANYTSGLDALNELNKEEGGNGAQFTSFKSGSTFKVKVLGVDNLIQFDSYGIYKQVNSFVAKNPSKKSQKGYPIENLTPWDKAWKYHKDLSKDFSDKHGQEASKYRCKQRFAVGFYDLTSGEQIVVDVSKPQAQAIFSTINENKSKLEHMTFKLTKKGEGTGTTVSLTPYINVDTVMKLKAAGIAVDEDLLENERENFEKAPAEFDMKLFEGILFEADDDQMIENLVKAGFDVSLIGLSVPTKTDEERDPAEDF